MTYLYLKVRLESDTVRCSLKESVGISGFEPKPQASKACLLTITNHTPKLVLLPLTDSNGYLKIQSLAY